MKTSRIHIYKWAIALAVGSAAWAADAPADPPKADEPPAAATPAPAVPEKSPDAQEAGAKPAAAPAPPAAKDATAAPAVEPVAPEPPLPGDGLLRLNFRGVPLEKILNYLSEAAGFVIVQEADVKGKVDAWSNTPLSKDEAVALLNSVLNQHGYAAIRKAKTLTIVSRAEAKKRNIPVKSGAKPEDIPETDEMVTQIIPVRYANAVQMVKDLQPLLPTDANLTANESGNALVLTDLQSDVRRMVEIVKALDTSISGISALRVFPLRYADAKDLANVIKELFPAQPAGGGRGGGGGNNPLAFFAARFGGGGGGGPGGGGGGPGGGGGQGGTGTSEARQAAARVTAVGDERTNSLVVSAPDELIATIEQLVKEIDTNAENVTELRVFRLKHSDAEEMAELLSSLFPDNSQDDGNRSQVQFGRGGFGGPFGGGGFGGRGAAAAQQGDSSRARQKGRVTAVPDLRTSSVVVSAASDLMPQISQVIEQIDADTAHQSKVFVFSLQNAGVNDVEGVLQTMFQSQYSRTSANSRQNTTSNPLTSRQQNQGYGNAGQGFGNTTGTGGGGAGGRRIGN
jgi:type II secretory pathway component GspD/PulD (secretin)